MTRGRILLATALLAFGLAVAPALGGPSNPIAQVSSSLKKRVTTALSTANAALSTANGAQSAADVAQAAAKQAQASADAANAAAANALTTAQGKQDRVRWAFVQNDGSIPSQSGGISMTQFGGGVYRIDFGSSQAGKAIVATPWGGSDGEAHTALCGSASGAPGALNCGTGGANDTNHIQVITSNSDGTLSTGLSFYVAVVP